MASNSYFAWFVGEKYESGKLFKLGLREPVDFSSIPSFTKGEAIGIMGGQEFGKFGCREAVVNKLYNLAVDKVKEGFSNYFAVIGIISQDNASLTKTKITKIEEFFSLFNNSLFYVWSDNSILYIKIRPDISTLLLTSLLLWIIRNDNILDGVLAEKELWQHNYESFLKYMRKEFITKNNYGSPSNSNVLLSMFCHLYLFEGAGNSYANGPANYAASNLMLKFAISYVKEVLLPISKSKNVIVSKINQNAQYVDAIFKESLSELISLYKNNEKLSNEILELKNSTEASEVEEEGE